jgi:antitoxin CptB
MSVQSYGLTRSSDDLDVRRRKALYHAWHRGTREMDLLMGRFADAHVADLSDDELGEFERLMEVPEKDIFGWMLGREDVPANYDGPLFRRIQDFARANPLTG